LPEKSPSARALRIAPPVAASSCAAAAESFLRVNTGTTAHWDRAVAASAMLRAEKVRAVMVGLPYRDESRLVYALRRAN